MAVPQLVYIILAAMLALGVSLFQYAYKKKGSKRLRLLLGALRFLSLLGLLLLLLNPKIKNTTYITVKPVLALAIDNSESIRYLGAESTVQESVSRFRESKALNDRFDIDYYTFGSEIQALDSLSFSEKQSDIAKPIRQFEEIYRGSTYVPILITDGNATLGEDYGYSSRASGLPFYALAAGDTIAYDDIQINRVNVNRYAYLNNTFPVEVFAQYSGKNQVDTKLEVLDGDRVVYSKPVTFDADNTSVMLQLYLPANRIGVRQYDVRLLPITAEKNTVNNTKRFAVEVIDQKTKILLVYAVMHPDLGALKKAIESNRLREVTLASVSEIPTTVNNYDLVILYEPQASFAKLYEQMNKLKKNRFTILGPNSDLSFFNQIQTSIKKENLGQIDESQGYLNSNFSRFQLSDIEFEDFPPLTTPFGNTQLKGDFESVLFQEISGLKTENPLLIVGEGEQGKEVVLLGSGIWKWRAASYVKTRSFETFDGFIEKLIQYSASNKRRERLTLQYDSFYYGGNDIRISAQYFDENYIFNPDEQLEVIFTKKENDSTFQTTMVLRNNEFVANLDNLTAGEYTFSVKGGALTKSGSFAVIPFAIEKQQVNANYDKLKNLAQETEGQVFSVSNTAQMIQSLTANPIYTPVQKKVEKTVPLIDFRFILFIIISSLAIEWFVRKYNGLI